MPLLTLAILVLTGSALTTGIALGQPVGKDAVGEDAIVVAVRQRGHSCENPKSVELDRESSTPVHAVWIVECENARYRVKLVGDATAVEVERLD